MSFSKRTQFLLGAATLAGQSRKPRCPPGALRFLQRVRDMKVRHRTASVSERPPRSLEQAAR